MNRQSLARNKVRELKNVATYIPYRLLSKILTREAAEIGRPAKAVTLRYFNK